MTIDVSNIYVRRAKTAKDVQKVFDIRWAGYNKYFASKSEMVDRFDEAENCILLLATDEYDTPIGTLRLLDSKLGETEIEQFICMEKVLANSESPFTEAARLSIPPHPRSRDINLALKKVFYLYSSTKQNPTMLIWARPSAVRTYKWWLFDDAGENGSFVHPRLGNAEHKTLLCRIAKVTATWRAVDHPLHRFMFDEVHSNLSFH